MRTCSVKGCDRKHYGRSYCQMHYNRWRNAGDVNAVRPGHRFTVIPVDTRIARNTVTLPSGCIVYTGKSTNHSGHKTIHHAGKDRSVHRVAWELANGPIPAGLVIRHKCDNPPCVNVDHLELGTVADNVRDRDQRGRL